MPAPVARAGERPERRARAARGSAAAAAPRVDSVVAVPDHAGEPERSVARRAAAEKVAPIPMPASACPAMMTTWLRRRIAVTSASVRRVTRGA